MYRFNYKRVVESFKDNVGDVYIDLENSGRAARDTVRAMDSLASQIFNNLVPTDMVYEEDGLYLVKGSRLNATQVDLGIGHRDLVAKAITADDIFGQLVQDPDIPEFNDKDLVDITLAIFNSETNPCITECFQEMIVKTASEILTDIVIE
ncbi:MAG: hypothetical protein ACRC92_26230 [Peptostreptococcaceae bacterium]